MACGRRCAVAGPTVQRTGSRSFPIASASSMSRAVVVVRLAKRCSDTGIPWNSLEIKPKKGETIATLPGGWDLAHAIRLGIKPFAELGAHSEALRGSQVDSPCSCRAIFESAPVAMLQSQKGGCLSIKGYLYIIE